MTVDEDNSGGFGGGGGGAGTPTNFYKVDGEFVLELTGFGAATWDPASYTLMAPPPNAIWAGTHPSCNGRGGKEVGYGAKGQGHGQ